MKAKVCHQEIFSGQVQGLAFGGQGIVRHEGLVVFVPFTAPGDIVHFSITSKKKNFAQGELVEVVQASPVRIAPVCPYFGICGGCQLQHINYGTQLEYKRQSIQDALHRIACLPNATVQPVQAAEQRWHYRRRIMLTLRPHKGYFEAGYLATDNHSLVTVDQCAIFIPQEDALITEIQHLITKLDNTQGQSGKLTLLKEEDGLYLLHFELESIPPNAADIMKKNLGSHATWSGILITTRNEKAVFGRVNPKLVIAGLTFSFSPQAFIQNHPEQSLNIYSSIVAHAKKLNSKNILDLYCGIGISSLLLAKEGFHIKGVESSQEAVKMAKANAIKNKLEDKAQFIQADVIHVLSKLLKKERPELVIVNPPRVGLDPAVVRALLADPPPAILYVSCMPPTMARDVKFFCENSYQLHPVEAYDMFPQTAHIETLVLLKLL